MPGAWAPWMRMLVRRAEATLGPLPEGVYSLPHRFMFAGRYTLTRIHTRSSDPIPGLPYRLHLADTEEYWQIPFALDPRTQWPQEIDAAQRIRISPCRPAPNPWTLRAGEHEPGHGDAPDRPVTVTVLEVGASAIVGEDGEFVALDFGPDGARRGRELKRPSTHSMIGRWIIVLKRRAPAVWRPFALKKGNMPLIVR